MTATAIPQTDGITATPAPTAAPVASTPTPAPVAAAISTPKAPAKYEFTSPIKDHQLPAEVVTAYSEVVKSLDLPQAGAQAVLDKLLPVMLARANADFQQQHATWEAKAKADKEYGGDKFEENLATAKKAMEKFGTPELKTFLDESDFGSHPEVIRWMHRVGKAISEEKFVADGSGPVSGSSDAEIARRLYPKSSV